MFKCLRNILDGFYLYLIKNDTNLLKELRNCRNISQADYFLLYNKDKFNKKLFK